MMKRRTVVAALCTTLAAVLFAGGAQGSTDKVRRIGLLAQDIQPGLQETFVAQLRTLGYVEGKNLVLEVRNAAGRNERLAALADELLRLKVEVIVAVNTPAVQAAKEATQTVPI